MIRDCSYWNDGVMECWNIGITEYWNIGIREYWGVGRDTPCFQYTIAHMVL